MDRSDLLVLRLVPLAPVGCPGAGRGGARAASAALKTSAVQSPSPSGLVGAAAHKAFTQVP